MYDKDLGLHTWQKQLFWVCSIIALLSFSYSFIEMPKEFRSGTVTTLTAYNEQLLGALALSRSHEDKIKKLAENLKLLDELVQAAARTAQILHDLEKSETISSKPSIQTF